MCRSRDDASSSSSEGEHDDGEYIDHESESSESESEPAARDVPLARDTTAATAAAATEQQPLRSWTADDPAVGKLIEQVGAYPATGGVYPYM